MTDGTAAHTTQIGVAATSADYDINFALAYVSGAALFEATDATGARGLYAVYGATGGVRELLTGRQGLYALQPSALTLAGTRAFFSGYDSSGKQGLWVTDGTTATELYANASGPALAPSGLTSDGTSVVFEGLDSSGANSLFWSDGTAAGTREVVAGLFSHSVAAPNFTAYGARVLFVAADSTGDLGLWASDGTSANTVELLTGQQGVYSLSPSAMVVVSFRAFFLATDFHRPRRRLDERRHGERHLRAALRHAGRPCAGAAEPHDLRHAARFRRHGRQRPIRRLGQRRRRGGNRRGAVVAGRRDGVAPYVLGVSGTNLIVAGYDSTGALSTWSIDGYPADTVEIANTAPLNPAYAFSLPTTPLMTSTATASPTSCSWTGRRRSPPGRWARLRWSRAAAVSAIPAPR